MGDKKTLAMAKRELEELYLGVPDDSVNLTFQDLAEIVNQENKIPSSKLEAISESSPRKVDNSPSSLAKLPSLDFNRGLEASLQSTTTRNLHHHRLDGRDLQSPQDHMYRGNHHYHHDLHHHANVHNHHHGDHGTGSRLGVATDHRSITYGDMSHVSGMSLAYGQDMSHVSGMSVTYGQERGGRRRRGIPHSNICAVCCNYIYIFRHRCLVCGRVYCRRCVSIGMGEMTEGRKCMECLGRRFSQRYILKAGDLGCCMGYSSTVKQQELIWAEKGPRRSGENRYGTHSQTTPTRQHSPSNPPSFVMNSPYSPTNHHSLPL